MAVWNCEGKLLGGLGISPGHTAWAESKEALDNWAIGHAIGDFSEYSYTRPDKSSLNAYAPGSVHVALPYDRTTCIDYVMFKTNDIDYGRWYYGAVMHREYVNANSTRLWFTLDYWLTFFNELRSGLGTCFIERTHVKENDDWNGDTPRCKYLNPEPFAPVVHEKMLTEWNSIAESTWDYLQPGCFTIWAASNSRGIFDNGGNKWFGGVPCCLHVESFLEFPALLDELKDYNASIPFIDPSNVESILAVTYMPTELIGKEGPTVHFFTTHIPQRGDVRRTDGTLIHNAKCLTYPYYFATAKSATGQQLIIKFEEYADESGAIEHYVEGGGGIVSRYRYGVRQDKTDDRPNMKFINLPEYPQLPIKSETFTQWIGANGISNLVGLGIASAMIISGIGTMGGVAAAGSTISSGAASASASAGLTNITLGASLFNDRMSAINQAYNAPDRVIGAAGAMDAAAFGLYRIGFYVNKPSDEDLTALDDFFDAYGYSVNRYAKPDLCVRRNWTYIKTSNANCRAAVPSEGIQQICAMLNNGTTFWNVTNCEIGMGGGLNPDV